MGDAILRRIGVVGTGIMGGQMARRLAEAGFEVAVWNRSPDKAEALVRFGIRHVDPPGTRLRERMSFSAC